MNLPGGNPSADISKLVRGIVAKKASKVELERFSEHLIDQFGGLDGLAREVWLEYSQLPKGHHSKVRLLGSIMSVIDGVTKLHGAVDPFGQLDMADLEGAIKSLVKKSDGASDMSSGDLNTKDTDAEAEED